MLIRLTLKLSRALPFYFVFLVAFFNGGTTNVSAEMGDDLWITGTVVNLRNGPSINDPVLLQLSRGTRVVEISRFEEWVEVTIDRDDIQVGWIHASLLESGSTTGQDEDSRSGRFQKFLIDFERFRNNHQGNDVLTGFRDISSDGEGSLQLTVTDEWLNLPLDSREEIISDIFRLWTESSDEGLGVSVEVVDKNKQAHMMIFR